MLTEWTAEVRHAWRALLHTPGFFVTSVATLALAIGAMAGMFSVVNTVILRPLPYAQPDRLVTILGTAPGSDLPDRFGLGMEFYLQYKEQSRLLDGLSWYGAGTSTFRTDQRVERVPMAWPSNDIYATLRARPEVGRLPRDEDAGKAVLLSDQMWNSWFGRDSSVLGKTFFVAGEMRQVIGVMPPDFHFPEDRTLLWVADDGQVGQVHPGNFGLPLVARLKPGVTREQLTAELTQLAKALPERFGGSASYVSIINRFHARVTPLLDSMVGATTDRSLWVLLGAAAIVLLIACANVANLFMVRAEGRQRDLAVRRAIGATRTQLVRLQMAEAFVVALAGGVLAVALAAVALPVFLRAAPEGIPRLAAARIDAPTVLAAFGLVLFAALACGAVPAVRASSPDFHRLREGGRGATARQRWARNALVVGQTALALLLLIGAALLFRSFSRLSHVDPGYDTRDVYTFQFAPQQAQLHDGPSWGHMHLDFMDRLRALPGVSLVGIVENVPLDEGTGSGRWLNDAMNVAEGGGKLLRQTWTAGDYFRAMGIRMLAGRMFTDAEAVTPNNSVIVSRSVADQMWPGESALGKRIRRISGDSTITFTVVGVVADVKQDDWRDPGQALVYFPLTGPTPDAWGSSSPAYVIKSARAGSLTREVRELVRQIAPEAPVYREYTMDFLARRSMVQLSFTMLTLGVVSALALILGAVGLYGVLSYVVAERTREIGVRMALGATATGVQKMVVLQGARVVLAGAVIGIGAALLSTRALKALLFGVAPLDPVVFVAMPMTLLVIGMLAAWLPARKASRVDPIEALRTE